MSWRGGAISTIPRPRTAAPNHPSGALTMDLPDIPGYVVWFTCPSWYARSNVHSTPEAASAAGVPWFVVAFTAADLAEAVTAREVACGAPA